MSLKPEDTGLKLQILNGQENYVSWLIDFKIIAATKGIWKLFTGDEEVLEQPNKAHFLPLASIPKPVTRASTKAYEEIKKIEASKSQEQKNEEAELAVAE